MISWPPLVSLSAADTASGKAWTTPWSVMAMALWPQRAAVATASFTLVRPSMVLILVCRCSSTRFSGAVSIRLGMEKAPMLPTWTHMRRMNSSMV